MMQPMRPISSITLIAETDSAPETIPYMTDNEAPTPTQTAYPVPIGRVRSAYARTPHAERDADQEHQRRCQSCEALGLAKGDGPDSLENTGKGQYQRRHDGSLAAVLSRSGY